MPPTPEDEIDERVAEIMAQFDENAQGEDRSTGAFWDFYSIGGRMAGVKRRSKVPKEKLKAFYDELNARNVTVSGLQWGKPELNPPEQRGMIDALWREMCPESGLDFCPIFKQGSGIDAAEYEGDVCPYREIADDFRCEHVIFAALDYKDERYEAHQMFQASLWNGVTWQNTTFDGTWACAKALHAKEIALVVEGYRMKYTPTDDWLVVTVDYHS